MRIAVISDTHIPDRADDLPKKIQDAFRGVDMIIHAGDFVEERVLDKLTGLCPNVKAVYGNMDSKELRKKLPQKQIIQVGKYRVGLMHGWGPPSELIEILEEAFKDSKVDIIIFGHSHAPYNEKKGNILFFNPGSATDKIFSPYNSYGIIEINAQIKAEIIKI